MPTPKTEAEMEDMRAALKEQRRKLRQARQHSKDAIMAWFNCAELLLVSEYDIPRFDAQLEQNAAALAAETDPLKKEEHAKGREYLEAVRKKLTDQADACRAELPALEAALGLTA